MIAIFKNIIFNSTNKTVSILLFAVLFFCISCAPNKPEEIKAIEAQANLPSLEMTDFSTFISDSGRVKYHVVTPHVLNFDKAEEPYTEYPKGGHIMTYDSVNVVSSQVQCEYAILYNKTEIWDLRNNVEAVNEDGVVFNTEQMFWDQRKKKIYTDKYVKITTESEVITGYGLTANENMKEYRLKKMSGTFAIDEQEE